MDAAAFSTGISIRWPRDSRPHPAPSPFTDSKAATVLRGLHSSTHKHEHSDAKSTDALKQEAAAASGETKEDEENYSACQEIAYQYAVEQARSAVNAVLLKANTSCYHQVLKYFDKYMSSSNEVVSADKSSVNDALVAFPEFHGFPTAAVVAGTDATFSEVWVNPLCQVLQRSFPLIFVVKDDFQNARRVVEWMMEQLDSVKKVREREETWLMDQIDSFDMLSTCADAEPEAGRRATLRARVPKAQAASLYHERTGVPTKQQRVHESDDEFVTVGDEDESDDEDDDDDSDNGGWRRRGARKKRKRPKRANKSEKAAGSAHAYSKWTMEQLLLKIQTELEILLGKEDLCKTWIDTLRDLVEVKLGDELRHNEDSLNRSLQCYNDTIDWLKERIAMCRMLPRSQATMSVNLCSTEFSLAQILHAILKKFSEFLEKKLATRKTKMTTDAGSNESAGGTLKQECELLDRWRRRVAVSLQRHEDHYQLHYFNTETHADDPRRPFFLICIEQLETFNQEVLDDFLVIWTNFSRQIAAADHTSAAPTSLAIGSRMGFIVGVASSASPALRRLNLSIVSQIDMQFFSLEDSRKCFDDILEALIVGTNLPLCLGGNVMRWIAGRHRTTQSITMFIHALEFLFFTHFKSVKWSFLSHFCLEAHWRKPLQSIMAPSKRLAQWIWRNNLKNAAVMTDYLFLFGDAKLEELRRTVFPDVKPEEDWVNELQNELACVREDRMNWAVGWKCFRAACSWLDVELQGDEFISYLASALDRKLANTTKIHLIMQKLETCSLRYVAGLMEDWKGICCPSAGTRDPESPLPRLASLLGELILVCQYAVETHNQSTTQKMLPHLRQEIKNTFSDNIIVGLVQAPRTRLSSPQVLNWLSFTDVQALEERLHFNYHNKLKELLLEIEEGEYGEGHAAGTSWVNDVSLAFLYYQESAGICLSLSDWYDTFADAVQDEFKSLGAKKKEQIEVETKARFLRAFCTLRHWGFVKSIGGQNGSDGDTIEKVVFI
ncbi:Origin recognition complex, subunit 3, partial [Globisporangium splendens]